MKMAISLIMVTTTLLSLETASNAQTGGSSDLSHNLIAGGGASNSAGGTFVIDGTIGQLQAGTVSGGGNFELRGGFWAHMAPATTAARVSVTGRVAVSDSIPMNRVRLILLQLSSGTSYEAKPNQFGYYRFDDLEIGTYVLRAESPNCQFQPSEIFVNLLDNLMEADFSEVLPMN
jgi:hypothetical protein